MTQDYSGQLDKVNKATTTPKLSFHNLECKQINQHRCNAASYNTCEVTKCVCYGLVLAQEPLTYATKIRSKLRGRNLLQGIEKSNRPRACIYATPDLCCSLIQFFQIRILWQLALTMCTEGELVLFSYRYT